MKLIKLEVYVLDFDGYGIGDAQIAIEQDCDMHARVVDSAEVDIGEWDDSHPLNKTSATADQFRAYFQESKMVSRPSI